jgi:hypothetical protein
MVDFDAMLARHPYELGFGVDDFAALEINGDEFRVLALPGKSRQVPQPNETKDDREMIPGVWIKYVDEDGAIQTKSCPTSGKVQHLFQELCEPSKHIHLDERMEVCRQQNPCPLDK